MPNCSVPPHQPLPHQNASPPEHVICLHGLGRTKFSMWPLARALRKDGYQVHLFSYPSRKQPIAESIKGLAIFLEKTIPVGDRVHFVGHSLGGLIAYHFAARQSQYFSLGRLVQLGSPNQGSVTAHYVSRFKLLRFLFGPALVELAEQEAPPAPPNIEIGVIAGTTNRGRGLNPLVPGDDDGIVGVEETKLFGIVDFYIASGLHSFLMFQPAIARQVRYFLQRGCFEKK